VRDVACTLAVDDDAVVDESALWAHMRGALVLDTVILHPWVYGVVMWPARTNWEDDLELRWR
jgi:hypothetical protein